ncbi:TPA_asm: N [Rhododendron delavayi virus 1]|uniref:Nucleoprotein n=1 Tax=Rhododendron delavayi virus 1 TaxID=2793739 RepID=A0A8D9PGW7_9RHAB|nr:N [Rhododendron delavayi virus 1] [Rhododendron delavayi virus 1]DAF42303.1 TPA_asm: N [Rhododendron delavayi virus 1]
MEITLGELTEVRSDYSKISTTSRPERPSGQCEYVPYVFANAVKVPFFAIKSHQDSEIIAHYKKFVVNAELSVTEEMLFEYTSIALGVKSPLDNTQALIANLPYAENLLDPDCKTRVPSAQNKIKIMRTNNTTSSVPLPIPSSSSSTSGMDVEEKTDEQALAICFAYAWATRFIVKSAGQGLSLQLNSMRETFLKLYGKSSKTLDNFSPSENWLSGIRNAFGAFPMVRNTIALYVSSAETQYKTNKPIHNLFRFLFYQSLEFVGMHAYVSMVNIMNKVPISPALVLTWLRVGGAENTIDEIADIMMKHDNGMIEGGANKERLWKYARLINEGHFNRVQTSYAPDVISLLVNIEIKLGLSASSGYNSPLNIYAIAKNESVREVGKAKAEVFIACVNAISSKTKGSSIIDKVHAEKHGGLKVSFGKEGEIKETGQGSRGKRPLEQEGGIPKRPAMESVPVAPLPFST